MSESSEIESDVFGRMRPEIKRKNDHNKHAINSANKCQKCHRKYSYLVACHNCWLQHKYSASKDCESLNADWRRELERRDAQWRREWIARENELHREWHQYVNELDEYYRRFGVDCGRSSMRSTRSTPRQHAQQPSSFSIPPIDLPPPIQQIRQFDERRHELTAAKLNPRPYSSFGHPRLGRKQNVKSVRPDKKERE